MEPINILICNVGDRHGDCMPIYYISINELSNTIKK